VFFLQPSEQTGTSRQQSARSDVEQTWNMIAFCSPDAVSVHWVPRGGLLRSPQPLRRPRSDRGQSRGKRHGEM